MSGEGRPTLDAGRLDGFAVRESGTVIGGRYRLEGVLGEGGMGVVHRATDQLLRRTVAIKQVRLPGGTGPRTALARERVLREARAAGRLHHPGAVGVLDVIDDGELPWIVMELVEGESLATLVQRTGGLPVERVARIGISLAYALEAAHKIGVIHRDVKPSNVIVTEAGQARLTDFGIAVSHGDDRLTGTGEVVGSPAYLAPERAHGEAGGPPSDVWGLGATLYHAVEGEPPFGGDSALAILTAVVEGRRRPAMRAGRITPILEAMLQADEAARPSLGIVRARLRDAAEEAPLRPSQARARLTAPKPAAAAAASPPGAAAAPPPAPGQAAAGAQPPVGQPVPLAPEATVPLTEEEAAALVDEETVALRDEPADEQPSAGSPSAEAATTVATPPAAGQQHADAAGQPHADAAGQPHADAAGQPHADAAGQPHADAAGQQHADAPGAPADAGTPPAAGAAAEAAPAPAGPPPADPLTPTLPEQTQALGESEPAVGDMTTVAWGAPGPAGGAAPAAPATPSAPIAGPGEQAAAGPSLRPRPLDRMRALGGIPGLARPDDAAGGTRGADAAPPAPPPPPAGRPGQPGGDGVRASLASLWRRAPAPDGTPPGPPPTRATPPVAPTGPRGPAPAARRAPGGSPRPAGRPGPAPRPGAAPRPGPAHRPGAAARPGPAPAGAPAAPGGAVPPAPPGARGTTRRAGRHGPVGGQRRRSTRIGIVLGAALVVVAVLAVVLTQLARVGQDGGGQTARPAGGTASRSVPNTADPDFVATDTVPAVAPPGWVSYIDTAGWSIAYPSTWERRTAPGDDAGYVDFVDPRTGTFLRVGSSFANPGGSVIEAWRAEEADFRDAHPDYQRVRLEPSGGDDGTAQADWEFTYSEEGRGKVHVLNRGAIRGGHGYALYWFTAEALWAGDQPLRRQMFSTFRPGP